MNIAIFSPYATVAPHFETELEIAERHLESADEVEFVHCAGELANCDYNPDGDPERCRECLGRRLAGYSMLRRRIVHHRLPMPGDVNSGTSSIPTFDDIAALVGYHADAFDVGYAALSSLVSLVRDPDPDLVHHRDLLDRLLRSALATYRFTVPFLENRRPDRVYVFNGRFASMRAVLRACQQAGIDCWMHERGCDNYHYELFPNHLPHDIAAVESTIRRMWTEGPTNRQSIAESWFHDRVARIESNWHSFVKHQQRGQLPADWDTNAHKVSIFCSSDDEFVAIGDCWQNELYPDQGAAIARLARDLAQSAPSVRLYLRMHPNLIGVDNRRTRAMRSLDLPNVTVIPPEAEIDSYALVRESDTVATFGSSVGIEAVFWGTPSVLLGPCFYRGLGGTYQPDCHDQAVRMLGKQLEPQDRTGALMYGFWLQTRGIRYQDYQPTGLFAGTFKGQTIYAGMKRPRVGWRRWLSRQRKRTKVA